MKKKKMSSFVIILSMVLLVGIGVLLKQSSQSTSRVEKTKTSSSVVASFSTTPVQTETSETLLQEEDNEHIVDAIMAQMTREEKVGQLFLARVPEANKIEDIKTYHLGGYLLFSRDVETETTNSLSQLINEFQSASTIPMFIASDEEGGTVTRISRNPKLVNERFNSPQALYKDGGWQRIAEDIDDKSVVLKKLGINLGLFPVADISTDKDSFIYDRTIGLDKKGTEQFVDVTVKELNRVGIGSTLKHFPGYGDNRDSHVEIVTDTRSLEELRKNAFPPFEAGIQSGADSILMSHNIISAIDANKPASVSADVHNIVRNELSFEGVLMTDDMDMAGLADFMTQEEAGLEALKAGNDLILSSSYKRQIPKVLEALESGDYSEQALNDSVKRVLVWKNKLGLL